MNKKVKLPSLQKAVEEESELSIVKRKILTKASEDIAKILNENKLRMAVVTIIGEDGMRHQFALKFQEEK